MEVETVYYRLWDKDTFNKGVEFANSGVSDGYSIIFDDDSLNRKIYSLRDMQAPNFSKSDFDFALKCTDIRTNNVAFIDILQDKIQDGYQACKDWLCGLMEDYSQRCGGNRLQDCKDWLKTTRLICDNPNIVEMCKDIENGLKEYPTNKGKKKNPSFLDIIQYEDKDKLLKKLHFLIDGKRGRDVGFVFVRAKHFDHLITRYPTEEEYKSEFELIGTWSAISNYFYKEEDNYVLARASDIVIFK